MEKIPFLLCQASIRFLNETERDALFRSLRPNSNYDFAIAAPGFIEAANGKFISLTPRCWTILSHAIQSPLSFQEAETLLNQGAEVATIIEDILLDRKASEYIVYTTNIALRKAKSIHRLSARGECFSIR